MSFPLHTVETAPAASQDGLRAIARAYGMIPNLIASLSGSPVALAAYQGLADAWGATSFSPSEQQLVLVAASVENGCAYCTAAHSAMATMAKANPSDLERVRSGLPVDGRLGALVRFTRAATRDSARLDREELALFLGAGYTQEQALEVIVGVAFKALTNGLHGVTDAPLDAAFAPFAWQQAPQAK